MTAAVATRYVRSYLDHRPDPQRRANDGYPEEWIQTLDALEKLDFYLTDLVGGVKKKA